VLHTIVLQLNEGARLRDCLEYLQTYGMIQAVFPPAADDEGESGIGDEVDGDLPPPDDGGFADHFLARRNAAIRRSRLTRNS
jgi:hypothetical protein